MLMQRPLGQTPGKTSHSFTSRQQKARSESWRLPGSCSLGAQDTTWFLGRWEEAVPASWAGRLWGRPGYQGGRSPMTSERALGSHHDTCLLLVVVVGEWR